MNDPIQTYQSSLNMPVSSTHTDTDPIRLDCCPYCGSENAAIHGATAFYAICLDCEASTGCYPSAQEAAKAWNRRWTRE